MKNLGNPLNASPNQLTPLQLTKRARGTSSDQGHAGDFGPNSDVFSGAFGGNFSARRIDENQEKKSQKIGASVIDRYSEGGGTNRHHDDLGAQSIARGALGGTSPSLISPFFRKNRLGGGLGQTFGEPDTPIVTPAYPRYGNNTNRLSRGNLGTLPLNNIFSQNQGFEFPHNQIRKNTSGNNSITMAGPQSNNLRSGLVMFPCEPQTHFKLGQVPLAKNQVNQQDSRIGNSLKKIIEQTSGNVANRNIKIVNSNEAPKQKKPSSVGSSSSIQSKQSGSGSSGTSRSSSQSSSDQIQDSDLIKKINPENMNKSGVQISLTVIKVNVHLNFMGENVLIKDVPTSKTKDQRKILLAPVIDHIKRIGKPVQFKTVSYYSAKDQMEVYVGVDPINDGYAIRIQDLDLSRNDLKAHSQISADSEPLTIKLIVKDIQSQGNLTINTQIYPVTHIQNNNQNVSQYSISQKKSDHSKTQKSAKSQQSKSLSSKANSGKNKSKQSDVNIMAQSAKGIQEKNYENPVRIESAYSFKNNSIDKPKYDATNQQSIELKENKSVNTLCSPGLNQKSVGTAQIQSEVVSPTSKKVQKVVKVVKRKGRPPKNLDAQQSQTNIQATKGKTESNTPRRCGRPRKKPIAFDEEVQSPSHSVINKRDKKQKQKQQKSLQFHAQDSEELPTIKGKTLTDARIVEDLSQLAARGLLNVKQKRTKERTITDIIEKVSTWRKLYNGIMVPNDAEKGEPQLQRWSLEDAASKVGVSKKSLDDYLLQLRFGKKFGFDFEENRDCKVGVLRLYVKKEKEAIKMLNGGQKISSKGGNDNTFYDGELDQLE